MNLYLSQAQYNIDFLKAIKRSDPNNYYDWKTTVIFYIAIQWMKAYLYNKYGRLTSHADIKSIINPKNNSATHTSPITQSAWNMYNSLYDKSRNSRYNGFNDLTAFITHNKKEFEQAEETLDNLYLYFKKKLPI